MWVALLVLDLKSLSTAFQDLDLNTSEIDICIRCITILLMRTTLDIDLDILEAAKEMAVRTRRTAGQVLSDLARNALVISTPSSAVKPTILNGFEILPAGDRVVTKELVQKLSEESELP